MAEFAFDPMETVNSLLPGYTRNPYALDRVTAGSSGGTAAGSPPTSAPPDSAPIRATPSAASVAHEPGRHPLDDGTHQPDGIVPLFLDKDIGGPMARTVRDAVANLRRDCRPRSGGSRSPRQVRKAGRQLHEVPGQGRRPRHALGVVRQLFTPQNTDPDVMKRMEQALADLRRLGATIVDPVTIAEIDTIPPGMLFCFRFKPDINDYLPRLAPDAQVKSLEESSSRESSTRRSRSGCSTVRRSRR